MARYRLTESKLRNMIREAVKSVLNEQEQPLYGWTIFESGWLGDVYNRPLYTQVDFSKTKFNSAEEAYHDGLEHLKTYKDEKDYFLQIEVTEPGEPHPHRVDDYLACMYSGRFKEYNDGWCVRRGS